MSIPLLAINFSMPHRSDLTFSLNFSTSTMISNWSLRISRMWWMWLLRISKTLKLLFLRVTASLAWKKCPTSARFLIGWTLAPTCKALAQLSAHSWVVQVLLLFIWSFCFRIVLLIILNIYKSSFFLSSILLII